ncbi:hypothetical protein [Enterococcus wangshanyuanii]|uniref:Uncharacterized protein n=1 Tax=Enterococcus wangshanyuanii TaxID=2005703 RepID=A0ABQ1PG94_9ENTE|nr:hypothetical protein [Enterococcus wangshanyuanii]GGC96578.1 hypothetical protein GCM10011573_27700 [Enterococcus wangshanyuanii]
MKGLIISELKVGYIANMAEIFNLLPQKELEKMWLISNYECNIYPFEQIPIDKDYVWLKGTELKELFNQEEIMFIWGVFTSFANGTKLKDVLQVSLPIADGNEALWKPKVEIIHPLGDTEFISWDGTVLLLKSKDINIIDEFKKNYSSVSKDLEEYNSN